MGQLETEIRELRQLVKDYKDGKTTAKHVNTCIGVYSQIEKRTGQLLKAYALQSRLGQLEKKEFKNSRLIGGGATIDTSSGIEMETIECPDQEMIITRHGCLEYSGNAINYDTCKSCPHFKQTRKLLHPEPGKRQ